MSGPLSVRSAVGEDVDAWLALFGAVVDEGRWLGPEAPLDRDWARDWFATSITVPTAARLVATTGDGTLVGSSHAEDRAGRVSLGMFVAAGARGSGVGRALLDASIDWALTRGAHKVHLEVWPHNEAAIRLYRSSGFGVEGRRVRHYRRRDGALWDSVLMGRVLDHDAPGAPFPG